MSDPFSLVPEPPVPGFEWTQDMRQISGFAQEVDGHKNPMGWTYERCCRAVISAACAWWAEHPDADPQFSCFQGVYGLCMEDNADAKALSDVMVKAAEPHGGLTGAQHEAAVMHVLRWRELGSWLAYKTWMRIPVPEGK